MVKKAAGIIGNVISLFLIIIITLSLYSMLQYRKNPDRAPSVLGFCALSVLSGSMRPYLEPGDMIVNRMVSAEEVKAGDVITYRTGSSLVTHRVVREIEENGKRSFITTGDANNTADSSPITEEQLVGKVLFKIPYGGYVARFIASPIGMLVTAIPVFLILIGESGRAMLSGGKK